MFRDTEASPLDPSSLPGAKTSGKVNAQAGTKHRQTLGITLRNKERGEKLTVCRRKGHSDAEDSSSDSDEQQVNSNLAEKLEASTTEAPATDTGFGKASEPACGAKGFGWGSSGGAANAPINHATDEGNPDSAAVKVEALLQVEDPWSYDKNASPE